MVDGPTGWCLGCFRTLPEIAAWARFDAGKRDVVMAALPARRAEAARLGVTL